MFHRNASEIIIPAVMPFSAEELAKKVNQVSRVVDYVQIDFMDGEFVPQASWPYEDGVFALTEIDFLESLVKQNPELKFEADLMIEYGISLAPVLARAGIHRIIFHHKAIHDPIEVIQFKEEFPEIEVGIALHVDDDIESVLLYKDALSMVQCMGIEKVGYQEQLFSEKALEQIFGVHKLVPHIPIQVDGGVNLETIASMAKVGAFRFVSGSAIFNAESPEKAIMLLASKI